MNGDAAGRLNLRLHHLRALVAAFCTDEGVLKAVDEPDEMMPVLVLSRGTVLYGMCRLNGKPSVMHASDCSTILTRHEWSEGTFLDHEFLTAVDASAEDALEGDPAEAMASFACGTIQLHEESEAINDWLVITDSHEIHEYIEEFGSTASDFETTRGQHCVTRRMRRGNLVAVGSVSETRLQSMEQQIAFTRDQAVCARMLRAWETDCIVHLPQMSEAHFDA